MDPIRWKLTEYSGAWYGLSPSAATPISLRGSYTAPRCPNLICTVVSLVDCAEEEEEWILMKKTCLGQALSIYLLVS